MRKLLMLAFCGVLTTGLGAVLAEEAKKVTIEGGGVCAKCALGEAKECQNVVIVEKDGKKTSYYLEKNDFFKDAHGSLGICTAKKDKPVKIKAVGTVVEKDGKHILTPTEKITKVD